MAQDSLLKGVGRLIGTATEIGAAVAGAVDRATAGGRELPPAPAGETPVGAIIRHGVSAATNVVRHIVAAAQGQPAGGAVSAGGPPPPAGPRVRQGGELRVPLSIENPGQARMTGLAPAVAAWLRDGVASPAAGAVRFVPERLDVEPRDFEKLTVFVDVDEDTPPGSYRLDIALGQGAEVSIAFAVVPGDSDAPPA